MFDYTQAAFSKVLKDFKRLRTAITVFVHLFSIAYLIYALATDTGFLIANVALLALTASYFVFFIIMETRQNKTRMRKRITDVYGWCKRLIKLPLLVIAVYGLALSKTDFDPISFMMTLFMIICWILEILFYFVIRFLEIEKNFIMDGLYKDLHIEPKKIPFFGEKIVNFCDGFPLSDNAEENYKKLQPIVEQRAKEREEKRQAKIVAKMEIKIAEKQSKLEIKATIKRTKIENKQQKKAEKKAIKLAKKNKNAPLLLSEADVSDEVAFTEIKKDK